MTPIETLWADFARGQHFQDPESLSAAHEIFLIGAHRVLALMNHCVATNADAIGAAIFAEHEAYISDRRAKATAPQLILPPTSH